MTQKRKIIVLALSFLTAISATALSLELERSFSTGLFSGSKDSPKEIFSFRFKNTSPEKLEKVSVEIYGPLMAEPQTTEIGSIEAGDIAYAKAKLPSLQRGGSGEAAFHIKATADGRTYEWDAEVDRIPPDWRRIHLMTHFHYDTVWIHKDGQRGYALVALDLINQYINTCKTDPTYTFALEQAPYLKPFWDTYPEHRQTLWNLMERNQLELVGGSYIQPDESSVFGEGLIRNYRYGRLFEEVVMKGRVTAAWQIDNFGHTPQLPQILYKSGMESFTFLRGGPIGLPRQFFWIAPDGSEIFSFDLGVKDELGKVLNGRVKVDKKEDVNMDLITEIESEVLPDTLAVLRAAHSVHSFFLPLGDDFMPPIPILGTLVRYWNGRYVFPSMRFSLPKFYFQDAFNDMKENPLNHRYTTKDLNPVFTGCYSSRTDIKIANRKAEMAFLDAEQFSTIANLLGADYPARALDKSLRELLYLEHHDSIPGTTNELSYVDIVYAWRESLRLSTDVRARSLDYITEKIDTSGAAGLVPFVVFNPLSFARTDFAEIKTDTPIVALKTKEGTKVPFDQWKSGTGYTVRFTAADVPSAGYKVFYAEPAKQDSANETVTTDSVKKIGNEYFEIEVDPARGGGIVHLIDMKSGRDWAADTGGRLMNSLFVYEDKGDLWGLNLSGGYSTTAAPAKIKAFRGNTFSRLIAESDHPEFSIRQTITLQNGVPLVFLETRIFNYKGQDRLFKLVFPVSSYEGLTPVYGERFTPIVRRRGEEFPADQWAGLSRSLMLRTMDGEIPVGVPAVVVHRGDAQAQTFARRFVTTLYKAGTPSVTFFEEESPDPTTDSVIYIGDPESYPALVAKLGADLNRALHTMNRRGMAVLIDGDRPIWMIGPRTYENEEVLTGIFSSIVSGKSIDLSPDMFLTAAPTRKYGESTIALINNGSNGYLFTNDGVMELQLLRSSTGRPGGEAYERAFSKEDWNHTFNYALAAGAGDWEKLGVDASGQAVNRPLLTVKTGVHGGALPGGALSFFSVEPKGLFISAVNKFDDSIPSYRRNEKYEGTEIRIYSGIPGEATATIRSFFNIGKASRTDMQGNNPTGIVTDGKTIGAKIGGRSIETFVIGTVPAKSDGTELGAQSEPVQPVYASYWRHNDNVSSLGFQPVTVSFDPVLLEPGKTEAELKIASDYTDSVTSGVVSIEAPDGWTVEPNKVEYKIDPYGYSITPLKISAPSGDAIGLVKAFYENEGQKFYTSLAVGDRPIPTAKGPSEVTLRTGESKTVRMTLGNDFPLPVSGEAVVVSAIGAWNEDPGTLEVEIEPFRAPFSIPAQGTSEFEIKLRATENALPGSYWFVLKLMANGEYALSNPVEVTIQP